MKNVLLVCSLATLSSPAFAGFVTFTGSGADPAAITPVRDAFRAALGGGTVAGANGLFQDITGARREINWDGVPDALSAPNNLPADFFNVNSPRGVVLGPTGTVFQVSAKAGVAPVNFGNIDPSYATTFQFFSPQRLFTPLKAITQGGVNNITDVNFFAPGTNIPGFVSAFGSVFSDVDLATSTSIQFFDLNNMSLGTFLAPASPNGGLSFLGVWFDAGEKIGRVRITSGNAALGAGVTDNNGDPRDLVVMDDFIFSNPVAAVPEPSTLLLIGPVLAGLALWKRRSAPANP